MMNYSDVLSRAIRQLRNNNWRLFSVILVVVVAGAAAHAPLRRVPENTLKYVVGVMLTSFGIFWGAEGAGAHWPAGDAAIPAIIGFTLATSLGLVAVLRRRHARLAGLMVPAD